MPRQQIQQVWKAQKWVRDMKSFSPLDFDTSVLHLAKVHAELGRKGLQCVLQGLSRPIEPCVESVRALIDDWEHRRQACCFQGNSDDLLKMKNVAVFAISYRHECMSRWYRNDAQRRERVSKMSDLDQKVLEEAIARIDLVNYPTYIRYSKVLVWCDQILSTRLKGEENDIAWYNSGLIPFVFLPVMALSTPPYSDTELEERVWIKAERSLARKGKGVFQPNQIMQYFHPDHPLSVLSWVKPSCQLTDYGEALSRYLSLSLSNRGGPSNFNIYSRVQGKQVLQKVGFLILSGYWPEPDEDDYWYKDYQSMRRWAIYICCRPDMVGLTQTNLFDSVIPVDFTEILFSMHNIAAVTATSEEVEKEYTLHDNQFYLKATAWNPWVSQLWPIDNTKISHYMGNLGPSSRFTWWISCVTGNIFGCMALDYRDTQLDTNAGRVRDSATVILAIKSNSAFTLFRSSAAPGVYRHAERNPNDAMKQQFESAAKTRDLSVDFDEEWSLLFSWDRKDLVDDPDEHRYPDAILQWTVEEDMKADAQVPYALMGTTVRLYRAAEARAPAGAPQSVIDTFISAIKVWNKHITESFDTFVRVKDSKHGPVWLEGYTKQRVTFGFLDFLTRVLFSATDVTEPEAVRMYHHDVIMPAENDVIRAVLKASNDCTEDVQIIVEELMGVRSNENGGIQLDDHEIATFVVSGGFTSTFTGFSVEAFVVMLAKRRAYWCTSVRCRDGTMQVIFSSDQNDARIAQRRTTLTDYDAVGLVRPGLANVGFVLDISEELTVEECKDGQLWKHMSDTFCRADVISRFGDARLPWDGGEVWLLDTTRCAETEEGIVSYYCRQHNMG